LPKSLQRISSNKPLGPPSHRSRYRVLFWLIPLLVIAALIAGIPNLSSSAQGNDAREASFNKKADKILQSLRRAVDEDHQAAQKGTLRTETSAVDHLSRLARVNKQSSNNFTVSVAVTLANNSAVELQAAGFRIQSQVGDVATLDLNLDQLPDLASLESVRKIFASVVRRPMNDRARQSVGIDNSSGLRQVAQTGRGVVVGIIDTGIDFRHADFTVPGSGGRQTRIKAMLDMTEYGTQSPDPGWNYILPGKSAVIGHLYTEADINSALQNPKPAAQNADTVKERDKSGHGTHVAGTAAGNGLASPTTGTYAGMAPEADLIIVKASRQNDGEDDFDTTDIINGLEFIKQKAAELGEPFVINLSIGGQIGPHDGTTPDERAIDSLVSSGTGRAVCVAAGNEGDSSTHARSIVPAGGSQTLDYNVNGSAYIIDLYQNKADRFNVTVTSPDGVVLGPVSYNSNGFSLQGGQASNQYLQLYNANDDKGDADVTNDQPDIVVLFKPAAPDGQWKVTLTDADGNTNQSYDAWTEGDGVYFSTFVDNNSHLVSSPGTARGAITVGAFVTRSATQAIGFPAPFTSPGPTADGRQKPDIGAPGYYLYSSRSSDVLDSNFGTIGTGDNAPADATHYTGLAGTSMATPVMTGAAALILQANPSVTTDDIKRAITLNAVRYQYDTGWTPRIGEGKLNVPGAISSAAGDGLTITARVADGNNNPVAGVPLLLRYNDNSQHEIIQNTDAAGTMRFKQLRTGLSYYLLPVNPYSFPYYTTPDVHQFINLTTSQSANFTAVLRTFYISGRVTNGSAGISGVTVSRTKANSAEVVTAVTNANGDYTFGDTALMGQAYTITPSKSGLSFIPFRTTFTNIDGGRVANFELGIPNPIDDPENFATQQYRDFLSREPDASGLGFWTNEITQCGVYAPCIQVKRINVSAAFFLSIEFQETGYLVERLYKTSYGDVTGISTIGGTHELPVPIIRLNEFLPDSQQIALGLVVNQNGWQQVLENNKVSFTQTFVQRSRFTTAFPTSLTAAQFVDRLFANASVKPSDPERSSIINEFGVAGNSADTVARARALRRVAENTVFAQQEKNKGFVLMQYFGYLRRDPNSGPDTDHTGYDYWLQKLNQFNGNFERAEMVKAFLDSIEYRKRFVS
jgi:subtilisin family serine protease